MTASAVTEKAPGAAPGEQPAGERFAVATEVRRRSFWQSFGVGRLDFIGNVSAEMVANQQGGSVKRGAGATIFVHDRADGRLCYQVATADLGGGTSPEQLLEGIERDLSELSVARFTEKYGFSA